MRSIRSHVFIVKIQPPLRNSLIHAMVILKQHVGDGTLLSVSVQITENELVFKQL